MKKTIFIFTVISVFAKVIAFCRELMLSYYFGASKISDIFLLSMTFPVTIFGFVAAGVNSGYIPIFQRMKEENGKTAALKFTSNVINLSFIFCCIVLISYFFFSDEVLRLFAKGFDNETLSQAKEFTNISIWTIFFTALIKILIGYLQINGQIGITALESVILNVGIIVTIFFAVGTEKYIILPIGFLISSLLQVFFLAYFCRKEGFLYFFFFDIRDDYIRIFLSGLTMLVFSSSLHQVNILIDRTLATTVLAGGLSLYEYGSKVNDFIMGLTVVPISAAVFPMMARLRNTPAALRKTLEDGIRLLSLIVIPVTLITIMFSNVIVKILYFRGAFNSADVVKTANIVKLYGFGLPFFSVREIILKCFYSIGDVRSPVVSSSIAVACNIALDFILLKIVGLGGLALATSISAVISVVLLYRSLAIKVTDIRIINILARCILLFAIAGVFCYSALLIYKRLNNLLGLDVLSFCVSIVCFSVIYIFAAAATGMIKKSEILGLINKQGRND